MYMIPKEVDGMNNYLYDELKEDLREDFDYWVVKRGCSVDGMYYYAMENYDIPVINFSIGEKICLHTFLFRIYMENDLYSERVLKGMNELFKNKEAIQQDLGEDYDRLLKEIDVIMDKYWRRVEAMSLHELMALYRRKG